MTTATRQAPPTEDEIRAALEARWDHPDDDYARDGAWIDYLSDALRGDAVWRTDGGAAGVDVLRIGDDGTERLERVGLHDDAEPDPRLAELLDQAAERIYVRCKAIAFDEFAAAALQFAAEVPDAPRGPDPEDHHRPERNARDEQKAAIVDYIERRH